MHLLQYLVCICSYVSYVGREVPRLKAVETEGKAVVKRRSKSRRQVSKARVLTSKNRFWRFQDLPGSSSDSQHLLSELSSQGHLLKVRKGLYWRGVATPLGMSPPSPAQLTDELAGGKGVGPAGLSASNLLHLSTQVPRHAWVAVPTRAPQSSSSVHFLSRATRTARAKERLLPRDVAVLETLNDWESVVEVPWAEAWARLCEMLASESGLAERLAKASRTEPGAVRARLSALLRESGNAELALTVPEVDPRTRQTALEHLVAA